MNLVYLTTKLNRHKINFVLLATLQLCGFWLALTLSEARAAAAGGTQNVDQIVAVVEDGVITAGELGEKVAMIKKGLRQNNTTVPPDKVLIKQVLERMIIDKIQLHLAEKAGIKVDEETLRAAVKQIAKPVGTFGDAAAFSFYPTKNMTSGEGGMIVYKDSAAARVGRLYRNQGMEKRYENEIVGFNLRMTDIHASIGRVQLSKLAEKTQRRQENAAFLSENILKSVEVPVFPSGYSHVFHQYQKGHH